MPTLNMDEHLYSSSQKVKMPALKSEPIIFEDLTIGDILTYLGANFCTAQLQYLKYGTDLRTCWEVIKNNTEHYSRICGQINLSLHPDVPQALVEVVRPFVDNKITQESILAGLRVMARQIALKPLPDAADREYGIFVEHLYARIEQQAKYCGLVLMRRLPPKKPKKSKKR